ncbi:MAG: hypothetical protein ACRDWH_09845, partial [Acidimicrobiia bacterium]
MITRSSGAVVKKDTLGPDLLTRVAASAEVGLDEFFPSTGVLGRWVAREGGRWWMIIPTLRSIGSGARRWT